jgi:hypothetical protein
MNGPRGIVTDVNKQTETLTGCTRDKLISSLFKNYFTDADRAEAGINRRLTDGEVTALRAHRRPRSRHCTRQRVQATGVCGCDTDGAGHALKIFADVQSHTVQYVRGEDTCSLCIR